MDEFTEAVKKLYRNGYSQKTVIKMVKDIFDSIRKEEIKKRIRWEE